MSLETVVKKEPEDLIFVKTEPEDGTEETRKSRNAGESTIIIKQEPVWLPIELEFEDNLAQAIKEVKREASPTDEVAHNLDKSDKPVIISRKPKCKKLTQQSKNKTKHIKYIKRKVFPPDEPTKVNQKALIRTTDDLDVLNRPVIVSKSYSANKFIKKKQSSEIMTHICDICQTRFPDNELLIYHKANDTDNCRKQFIEQFHFIPKEFDTTRKKTDKLEFKETNISLVLPAVPQNSRYTCDVCHKDFAKSTLGKHKKTHNTNTCDVCKECFKTSAALANHREICSVKKLYEEVEFQEPLTVKEHKEVHFKEKSYCCNKCDEKFNHKHELVVHLKIHARENNVLNILKKNNHLCMKKYACKKCDKLFSHAALLTRHSATHIKLKPFSCESCGKSFSQRGNLIYHKRIHSEGHSCKECKRRFTTMSSLLDHERKNTGTDNKCGLCNETFILHCGLTEHLKKHSHINFKPFSCNTCGKSFSQKCNLMSHKRMHLEDHVCKECKRRFRKMSSLLDHERDNTGSDNKCGECNETFILRCGLTEHLKKHSQTDFKPFTCNTCGKSFSYKCSLMSHKRTHSEDHVCKECKQRFRKMSSLLDHKRKNTGTDNKCGQCNETFILHCGLKEHMNKHSNEEPNLCGICNEAFETKAQLHTHEQDHSRGQRRNKRGRFITRGNTKEEIKIQKNEGVDGEDIQKEEVFGV